MKEGHFSQVKISILMFPTIAGTSIKQNLLNPRNSKTTSLPWISPWRLSCRGNKSSKDQHTQMHYSSKICQRQLWMLLITKSDFALASWKNWNSMKCATGNKVTRRALWRTLISKRFRGKIAKSCLLLTRTTLRN